MNPRVSNSGHEYGVKHFYTGADGLLIDIISSELSLPMAQVQELMLLGAIYQNQTRNDINCDTLTRSGDLIRVHTQPRRFQMPEFCLDKHCVFENTDFLIINKPAGIPVHAIVDNSAEHMLAWLKPFFKTELHITHRLDIATSGLIVVAKNKDFQSHFNKLLQSGDVQKKYHTFVEGHCTTTGLITHFMKPSPKAPKLLRNERVDGWLECKLLIESTKIINEQATEIHIQLLSGRTHQIRAQMAALGHPIVGDVLYGAKFEVSSLEKIRLTCVSLSFDQIFKFQI